MYPYNIFFTSFIKNHHLMNHQENINASSSNDDEDKELTTPLLIQSIMQVTQDVAQANRIAKLYRSLNSPSSIDLLLDPPPTRMEMIAAKRFRETSLPLSIPEDDDKQSSQVHDVGKKSVFKPFHNGVSRTQSITLRDRDNTAFKIRSNATHCFEHDFVWGKGRFMRKICVTSGNVETQLEVDFAKCGDEVDIYPYSTKVIAIMSNGYMVWNTEPFRDCGFIRREFFRHVGRMNKNEYICMSPSETYWAVVQGGHTVAHVTIYDSKTLEKVFEMEPPISLTHYVHYSMSFLFDHVLLMVKRDEIFQVDIATTKTTTTTQQQDLEKDDFQSWWKRNTVGSLIHIAACYTCNKTKSCVFVSNDSHMIFQIVPHIDNNNKKCGTLMKQRDLTEYFHRNKTYADKAIPLKTNNSALFCEIQCNTIVILSVDDLSSLHVFNNIRFYDFFIGENWCGMYKFKGEACCQPHEIEVSYME
jgi:hypothetical protein